MDEKDVPHKGSKEYVESESSIYSPQPDKASIMQSLFSFENRPMPSQPSSPPPRSNQSGADSVHSCPPSVSPPPRPCTPSPLLHEDHHRSTRIPPGHLFVSYRPPPPPPPLERPLQLFQLSDFFLLRTLGTGTFGRVRLVRYRSFEKFFAMKMMKKADVVRFKQEKHVMNERWLLARLNFPFIVRMYAAFQDSVNLYLLMEYAIGGELYSYLRRAGRFSLATTKFYAAEIMMAIEYLHNMDIAYRDLKPENLLLDSRGHVKLSDFGFAKHVPDHTWTLCGTPEYLAPEIISNKGHGKAVDWWALGVLIYEMLAGFPPYYDQTPFSTYEKILAGRLTFPGHFDPCSIDLIRRLLQPDPSLRLGNLQGGAQDIRRHPWFAGVDWHGLFKRTIMAPIQPRVLHPGDTGNFDRYAEETSIPANDEPDPYANLFISF